MKAGKGDLIRIVNALPERTAYKNGDIFEVLFIDEDGDANFIDKEGDQAYVTDREYVIHRKAGEEEEAKQDAVNSPSHYTQGRFETIEVIEEITKGYEDGYVAYCVGNALKYLARAPFKHGNPTEDLAKAAKYLAFANEYLDGKQTQLAE